MIGIGNDIIEIRRIKRSLEKYGEALIDRLLTPKEKAYCRKFHDPSARFAGRFAAKEAVAKALSSGFGKRILWQEIEILNDAEGRPIVSFAPSLLSRFPGVSVIVSISHSHDYAAAVALRLS